MIEDFGIPEIKNKVSDSGLLQIQIEDFFPKNELDFLDISEFLEDGILREKNFREKIKDFNWGQYQDKILLITNSQDSIVPLWAYFLIAGKTEGIVKLSLTGSSEENYEVLLGYAIENLNTLAYQQKKIVVKGCGDRTINPSLFMLLIQKLQPVASSIMFGEPCSTVPIFKAKNLRNNF